MLVDHLEKLHYFFEVGKSGSMKSAAKNLFITQPSLSKSMKILEQDIGKNLFNRTPKGVDLTKEGWVLFNYCKKLFSELAETEKELLGQTDPFDSHIRIGTYESLAVYFWPGFLAQMKKIFPNLSFEIKTDRSEGILKELSLGNIDIALVIDPKKKRDNPKKIRATECCPKERFASKQSFFRSSFHRFPDPYT